MKPSNVLSKALGRLAPCGLCVVLASACSPQDIGKIKSQIAPARIAGKFGYVTVTGKIAIEPRYDAAQVFAEGVAGVRIGTEWMLIDSEGKPVSSARYEWIGVASEGLIPAKKDDYYGFLRPSGEVGVDFRFASVGEFAEGLAAAATSEGWGYIDAAGDYQLKPTYKQAGPFRNGYAIVIPFPPSEEEALERNAPSSKDSDSTTPSGPTFHELQTAIDRSGRRVADAFAIRLGNFSPVESQLPRERLTSLAGSAGSQETDPPPLRPRRMAQRWVLLDEYGKVTHPGSFDLLGNLYQGIISFKVDGKWGFMKPDGEVVVEPLYDNVGVYVKGIPITAQIGQLWGFARADGSWVVEPKYSDPRYFYEGLAAVNQGLKWGFIDAEGTQVVPPVYSSVRDFNSGLAHVKEGKLWGVIDSQGSSVIPCQYDAIGGFCELDDPAGDVKISVAVVVKDKQYGIITESGEELVPCQYQYIGSVKDNFTCFQKGGFWGLLDVRGEIILPATLQDAFPPRDGWAMVEKDRKWAFANRKGDIMYDSWFSEIFEFTNGLGVVTSDDGEDEIINSKGEVISKQDVYSWAGAGAVVKFQPSKWAPIQLLRSDGKAIGLRPDSEATPEITGFGKISDFAGGLATGQEYNDENYYVITSEGNYRAIPAKFTHPKDEDFYTIRERHLRAIYKTQYEYVDAIGNPAFEGEFDSAAEFDGQVAKVRKGGDQRSRFINRIGQWIVDDSFDEDWTKTFEHEALAAMTEDKCYLISLITGGVVAEWKRSSNNETSKNSLDGWSFPYPNLTAKKTKGNSFSLADLLGVESAPKENPNQLIFVQYGGRYPLVRPDPKNPNLFQLGFLQADGVFSDQVIDVGESVEILGSDIVFKSGGKYGWVNPDGTVVKNVAEYYGQVGLNGLRPAKRDAEWGYLDRAGEWVISPKFDWADSFQQDGIAKVTVNGVDAYINLSGEFVFLTKDQTRFRVDSHLGNGLAIVEDEQTNLIGLIRPTGDWLVQPRFDSIRPVAESALMEATLGAKRGFIDLVGEFCPTNPEETGPPVKFTAMAPVYEGDVWKLVTDSGHKVSDLEFDECHQFQSGLLACRRHGRWGFVDPLGNVKIEFRYQDCRDFHEGLAAVKTASGWGYITPDGDWAIKPDFEDARDFTGRVATVRRNGCWGAIDTKGVNLAEFQFNQPLEFCREPIGVTLLNEPAVQTVRAILGNDAGFNAPEGLPKSLADLFSDWKEARKSIVFDGDSDAAPGEISELLVDDPEYWFRRANALAEDDEASFSAFATAIYHLKRLGAEIRLDPSRLAQLLAHPRAWNIWDHVTYAAGNGIVFAKIPGTDTQMAFTETTVRQFAEFIYESPGSSGFSVTSFEQTGDHPVVSITANAMINFLKSMSQREWDAGSMGRDEYFSLPNQQQLLAALGFRDWGYASPWQFKEELRKTPSVPWIVGDVPPVHFGNLADDEFDGYSDGFAYTSPVASFNPGKNGFYDLIGNAYELTNTFSVESAKERYFLGGSWRQNFLIEHEPNASIDAHTSRETLGFRCILRRRPGY